MSNTINKLLLILPLVFVLGCEAQSDPFTKNVISQIELGMSEDDVISIIGEPARTHSDNYHEDIVVYYYYYAKLSAAVIFKDEKVINTSFNGRILKGG